MKLNYKFKKENSIFIIVVLVILVAGCSYSRSRSESKISIKFDKFNREKIKKFKITKEQNVKISYSEFKLEKGTLELLIMSPDGKIVFHKVLTSDTSEDGNFIINDLDKNKQYILKLVGKKAEKGKINIRVISKYFKLI